MCVGASLLVAVIEPAELCGDAVLGEGVECLQLLVSHLCRVFHPSNHSHLKAGVGGQPAANDYILAANLADYWRALVFDKQPSCA